MPRVETEPLEVEGLPEGWTIRHAAPDAAAHLAGRFELRQPPTLTNLDGDLDHHVGIYTTGYGIDHEWIEQPYSCCEGVSTFESIDADQLRGRTVLYGLVLEMYPDAMGGD